MKKIELQGIDEFIYYDVTKSGLPVYFWINNRVQNYHASLNVYYGSIHTNFKINDKTYKVPAGIAHFLEHIKFNEEKNYTSFDYYHENSVTSNASTTFEYTNYLIWGNSKINENVNHLLDFVFNPYFSESIIANEKGIIIEETNMTMDDPYAVLNFGLLKNLLNTYSYRNFICGTEDDIKNINLEDIKLIYNTYYHPQNMFLVVTGNFNPDELMTSIEENMNNKVFDKYLKPKNIFGKEKNTVFKEFELIESDVSTPKIAVGVKIPLKKFKNTTFFETRLITKLILDINFGDTSDFKEYILDNNIATSISFDAYQTIDYLVIMMDAETKYPYELLEKIKDKLNNLTITKEEFKRKINVLIATLVMQYDDISNVNRIIQENLVYDGYLHTDDKKLLENITFDKVGDVLKYLDMKNMSSIIMDKKKN